MIFLLHYRFRPNLIWLSKNIRSKKKKKPINGKETKFISQKLRAFPVYHRERNVSDTNPVFVHIVE